MFKTLGKIIRFIFGGGGNSRQGSRGVLDRQMIATKWAEIEQLMELGGPSRFKAAIMDADKLLDYTLRGKGYKGETLGERLKFASSKMDRSTLDAAWNAHKYRNRIAHEIDTDVMHFEVKKQIENFKRVFRYLGVL